MVPCCGCRRRGRTELSLKQLNVNIDVMGVSRCSAEGAMSYLARTVDGWNAPNRRVQRANTSAGNRTFITAAIGWWSTSRLGERPLGIADVVWGVMGRQAPT